MLMIHRRCLEWASWGAILAIIPLEPTVAATGKVDSSKRIDRHVIASGGTVAAQSATRRVSGTVGQLASNRSQSSTVRLGAGFWNGAAPACSCPFYGDLNGDGVTDVFDVVLEVDIAFRNAPIPPKDPFCPTDRADYNCDGVIDVFDVVGAVSTAFRDNDTRCKPCER